jgi:MinD-like ATPase involved in chromosome partitioning or flagellar assembly
MTTRILVTGVKGGSGKSTVALWLAKEAMKFRKVLILDLDYTRSLSRTIGLLDVNDLYSGNSQILYWTQGNFSILSLGGMVSPGLLTQFQTVYPGLLDRHDLVIIDASSPTHELLELEGKISHGKASLSLVLLTTPHPFTAAKTLEVLNSPDFFPEADDRKVLVVNMVKDEIPEEVERVKKVVKIPLIKQLILYGPSPEPPKDMRVISAILELSAWLGLRTNAGDGSMVRQGGEKLG